ncbi:MAG: nodulation protein NfeD [Dehalococcoidia bacterium]|nr:nodulation protein NfeD [Dehalococcoidia bacterium]
MRRAIKIFKLFVFALLMLPMALGPVSNAVDASTSRIEVLHVEGTIVPVVSDYINRGIRQAEEENASACIIELNTPGGLLGSTEKIVGTIMNADVPIVVFVAPKGAWAASAGTFITLSAHVAAMTPGTTIGAAHPVSGGGEEIPEDQMKKITEFSAKWMKTIAQERGRNMEEAELAVTGSKSFTDVDALELNLIDLRADNLEDLISKINGTKVTLASGKEVTIDTTSYGMEENEMNAIERFLLTISDPNIAYILMTLATIGLITEISNPGMIFPGVAGGISLLLAFYSLGVLNAYWGGVALILLGIGLLITELFTSSFGLLTGGGVIALVMGSLVLFSHSPGIEINRGLIAGVTAVIAAFCIFAVGAIIRGQKRRKATGAEGMVGEVAITRTPLDPEGKVLAEGELWSAITDGERIEPREEVIITRIEELRLRVKRKSKEEKSKKGAD